MARFDAIDCDSTPARKNYCFAYKKSTDELTSEDYNNIKLYAGNHIGFFLTWVIKNHYEGEIHKEDPKALEALEAVRNEKMSGTEYLIEYCDEKFLDLDVSDDILPFIYSYYMNDYLSDYGTWVIEDLADLLFDFIGTWEDYHSFQPIIDAAFRDFNLNKENQCNEEAECEAEAPECEVTAENQLIDRGCENEKEIIYALEKIDFSKRYRAVVEKYPVVDYGETLLKAAEPSVVSGIIASLGYDVKYHKTWRYYETAMLDKSPVYKVYCNIGEIQDGMVEMIWTTVSHNTLGMGFPVRSCDKHYFGVDERMGTPGFHSYEELTEVLKDLYAIYLDFIKVVIPLYESGEWMKQDPSFSNIPPLS